MNHVVALSGGKDSTAMALLLNECEPRDYEYVCTPTGDELPEMWEHWRKLGEILGKPLLPITGDTLKGCMERNRAIPNFRMRFCTRELKIAPYKAWLLSRLPAVSYVGLRADEEGRDGMIDDTVGLTIRYPLREWGFTEADVLAYLKSNDIHVPKRTDCARCFYQRLGEWWHLWRDHPDVYADAEADEATYGHTYRSEGRDTWPAGLKELRERFESGEKPERSLAGMDKKRQTCRVCSL